MIYTFGQAEIEEEGGVSSVVVVAAAAFQFFQSEDCPWGGKGSATRLGHQGLKAD
jgi:hypothetical protein